MVAIDLFKNSADTVSYSAGQKIFSAGDIGDMMYVVVQGQVELQVKNKKVEELGPGGVLGEMSLIDSAPRSATAIAVTDCALAAIDEKRFKFLIQQTPNFALQIMRVIADRLRRMDSRL